LGKSLDKNSKKISQKYDRNANMYDIFEAPMDRMVLARWRSEIMQELQGKVLEVGVGTGKNIDYYPDGLDITAIDFSEKMLEKAKERAAKLGKKVNLMLMDAQEMAFEDNTFDTVFATCVFCTVPDPVKGLQEIKRVCKKDGKIILIEHVRSEGRLVGVAMDILNPLVLGLTGTNINRRTVENIEKAGFANFKAEDIWRHIVKKIVIYND